MLDLLQKIGLATAEFKAVFDAAKSKLPEGIYGKLSTQTKSNRFGETYFIRPEGSTGFREFTDEIGAKNMGQAWKFIIENKTFYDAVRVMFDEIEDDNYKIYKPVIQEYPYSAQKFKDKLFAQMLENWTSVEWYDGVAFFSNAHPLKAWTQSNYFTGKPLNADNLREAVQVFRKLRTFNGEIIGDAPDTIIVWPENEFTALELLKATSKPSDTDDTTIISRPNVLNTLGINIVVVPYLEDTGTWYLAKTKWVGLKPFIYQARKELQLEDVIDKTNRVAIYQAITRFNFGYGEYRRIIRFDA